MDVELTEQAGLHILTVSGEIDLHVAPDLRARMLAALGRGGGLLVDLSAVTYMDSSGIATLVEGFKKSKDAGARFGLVGVRDAPLQVLQLTRLDQVFPLYPTLADALQAA